MSSLLTGIQFFPSVQDPHRICTQLSYQGYACSHLHYNLKLGQNQSLLLLVEFRNIIGERPASLRNHDEVIANVSRRIEKMSDDWVCIYTARHRRKPMVVVKKCKLINVLVMLVCGVALEECSFYVQLIYQYTGSFQKCNVT